MLSGREVGVAEEAASRVHTGGGGTGEWTTHEYYGMKVVLRGEGVGV